MPIAKKRTFENVPEGTYKAVLHAVREEIQQSQQYGNQEKLRWTFRMLEKQVLKTNKVVWEVVDPKGPVMSSRMTGAYYGGKTAALTAFFKSLLNPFYADAFVELERDYEELTEQQEQYEPWTGTVTVEHTGEGDKVYANVTLAIPDEKWMEGFMARIPLEDSDPFVVPEIVNNIDN